MRKQIIAILLLLMLVMPVVVTYFWTQQRMHLVKRETKQKLAHANFEELEVLTFSKANSKELNWKHNMEFEYNQKMYDVVHKSVSKDSIKYWCWLDKEETHLNTKLKTLLVDIYSHDLPLKQHKSLFFQFYKSLFFEVYSYNSLDLTFLKKKNVIVNSIDLYSYQNIFLIFHPPNIISC